VFFIDHLTIDYKPKFSPKLKIYVVVQLYPWYNLVLSFALYIIINDKKEKFHIAPRAILNHNIYTFVVAAFPISIVPHLTNPSLPYPSFKQYNLKTQHAFK